MFRTIVIKLFALQVINKFYILSFENIGEEKFLDVIYKAALRFLTWDSDFRDSQGFEST